MVASHYHELGLVEASIQKYTSEIPDEMDKVASCGWESEDDLLLCIDECEEAFEASLSVGDYEDILDGKMDVGGFIEKLSTIEKTAKLTTPAQRQKMREYRLKNKAKLQRSRRLRKRRIQSGAHRVKKRQGTAQGGYTFIDQPQQRSGGTTKHSKSTQTSVGNFNPEKNTRSTHRKTKLTKVAFITERMRKYQMGGHKKTPAFHLAKMDWEEKIAAVKNHDNPIAGKLGYPPKPKKPKGVDPPKPPKPPKLKSALTHNSLPQGKVNTKPKFKSS